MSIEFGPVEKVSFNGGWTDASREINTPLYEEVIFMAKFSARERMALKVLSNLKHNGTEFIKCRFNDCLLNFVKYVLRINPFEVASKALANRP